MPDLLTLDVRALLDSSEVGKHAAAALAKLWEPVKDQEPSLQSQVLKDLEFKRAWLRKALLERARPVVESLAKKKKARWVLESGAVLWGDREDITKAVVAEIDAQGPLQLP